MTARCYALSRVPTSLRRHRTILHRNSYSGLPRAQAHALHLRVNVGRCPWRRTVPLTYCAAAFCASRNAAMKRMA